MVKPERERWQRIEQLCQAVLDLEVGARAAFLHQACAGDDALRCEVESLLKHHERAEGFIETPALQVAAKMIVKEQAKSVTGRQISHYQIISLLGVGGMGEVYLARDTQLGRQVALKLLPEHLTENQENLCRFEQEARAASALNHPNIVTIHEIGATEGTHFIATEHVDGKTLRQFITNGAVKLSETLDIVIQVASALAAAHAAGIVHRDIKPENVMVRTDGYAKVLDFGLAKLIAPETIDLDAATRMIVNTTPGMVMGTPMYMSPEQARGREVDARTDIWSLGVVIYEMIAGRAPFAGETTSDVIASILQKEPSPLSQYAPEIPTELESLVRKALSKDREERYRTSRELLTDLKGLKQRLEFEAELERTEQPASKGGAVVVSEEQGAVDTTKQPAARTASSVEYVINGVKRYRIGAALATLAVVVAVAMFFYAGRNQASALTEKDTILLADFVNTTGDAVFDGTLKQALAVQLEQSPFLNIYSDERVREALRFMGRSPDERVTKDVAREICERHGLKAMLTGSISNLGNHYVIGLETINARTGDVIARSQMQVEGKEQVLKKLGEAASKFREKLGESLGTIQKFDVPSETVTTPSLEAFKAYSLGMEQRIKGRDIDAIPFLKRAIELDQNFALAHADLSVAYRNTGQPAPAAESAKKAFELRERVSERERLDISARYYDYATGETDKLIEVAEVWKRTYPLDPVPHNLLAISYAQVGQPEKVIEEAREAIRLNPKFIGAYSHLGHALIRLNRFEEAQEVFEQALAQGLDFTFFHVGLYMIAFVRGDQAAMQQQIAWAKGKGEELLAFSWQSQTAAALGQLRKAREFSRLAADSAKRRGMEEVAGQHAAYQTLREANLGMCGQTAARSDAPSESAAITLALCGRPAQAQSLADEMLKLKPKDTLVNGLSLRVIGAAIETNRGNPDRVIQLLEGTSHYEGVSLWPVYLRGQAYLRLRKGTEAASEFQKILDRRGQSPLSYLYPLAHLQLARAAALVGDANRSRQAYEQFFDLWKDADIDLPVLVEAKKEYKKLR